MCPYALLFFFFFNDPPPTEIYTLPLHDALPISAAGKPPAGKLLLSASRDRSAVVVRVTDDGRGIDRERVLARAKVGGLVEGSKTELSDEELLRSEEHTSELQSRLHLVCRLLPGQTDARRPGTADQASRPRRRHYFLQQGSCQPALLPGVAASSGLPGRRPHVSGR